MKASMRIPFAFLCGVPFVMVLSNSLLIPVLPLMQSQMQLTPFQVGLIVTAFSVPAGLTIPLAGFLSDRFGRKIVIVPALFIFGIGGLLAGIAALLIPRPFPFILAARVLQGLGGGGTYQMAMALTGDIFQSSERAKALGLLESANGLGKVVSPILGSLAGLIIWFAPFFIYPLLSVPIAIGVWVKVKEPEREKEQASARSYFSQIGKILKRNALSLGAAYIAGSLVLFMLFGLLSYLSDVLENNYGIEGLKKGFVIAIPVLGMALTSYLSGAWLQKQAGKTCKLVSIIGMAMVAIALLFPASTTNLYLLLAAATVQGIGTGSTLPAINLLITGAAAQHERGMITALYGTARFFGAAFGPPIFGWLVAKSKPILFIAAAITIALMGIIAYACIKAPKMPKKESNNGHTS
ncbi:MAG TPA: MFS transporter [Firmicutes bacterium]|nr:MFS transporter [Bacillota bacterium]